MADKILNPKTGRMVSITGKIGKAIAAETGVAPEGKIYNPKTKRFVKATLKRVKEASVAKMKSRPAPKKVDAGIDAYERKVFELENELFRLRKLRDESLVMAEKLQKDSDAKSKKSTEKYKKDTAKVKELLEIVEFADKKIVKAQKELKSLVKPSKAAKKIPTEIIDRILAMANERISAKYKNIPPGLLAMFNDFTKDVPNHLKRHWREDLPKFLNKYMDKPFQLLPNLVFKDENFAWEDIDEDYDDYYGTPEGAEDDSDQISKIYYNILAYATFISETTDQLADSIVDFYAPQDIFMNAYENDKIRRRDLDKDTIYYDDYVQRRDEIIEELYERGELPEPTRNLLDGGDEDSDEEESTKDFLKEFFDFVARSSFNKYFKIVTKFKKDFEKEYGDAIDAKYDELVEDENEEALDEDREEQLRQEAGDIVNDGWEPETGRYEIYFVGK